MANPRQRAKARSSRSTKPSKAIVRRQHHKLRKAPPLRGPEVLQKSWDRHKTVFQNYAALGLLPSIPLPKGPSSSRSHRAKLDLPAEAGAIVGYGRIVRDDEGNVVDIILPEESGVGDGEKGGEGDEDEGMELDGGGRKEEEEEEGVRRVEGKTDVVRSLEALSNSSAPIKRHTSTSELTWLKQLVQTHGEDYESMSRDRKGNVWQKTPGEIRRMVKKAGLGV